MLAHGTEAILTLSTLTSPLTQFLFVAGVCLQGVRKIVSPLIGRLGLLLDNVQVLVLALSGLIGRVLVVMTKPVGTLALTPLDVSGLWTSVLPLVVGDGADTFPLYRPHRPWL